MIKLSLFNKGKNSTDPVKDIIVKIKGGDGLLKEKFISDYRPFILKSVSRASGEYIEIENDEEYSVGLSAFNEAIESYDAGKNCSFLNFAAQVIKRRVIDYKRSNYKNQKVYPFTYFEDEEYENFEERYLNDDFSSQFDKIEIREEIILFNQKLDEFGITLEDLVLCAPRHRDSKQHSIRIARLLAENRELYEKMDRKKNIPMVDLMKLVDVNQRTIERNRKFIIAVCLILNSGLDVLKGYVKNAEKGGESIDLQRDNLENQTE